MKHSRVVVPLLLGWLASPASAAVRPGLTHDLTVAAMFQQADWVVKTVMGVLVLASVATLSIWIYKTWEIVACRRTIATALKSLSSYGELASFVQLPDPVAAAMVQVAIGELERYPAGRRHVFAEGIKERTAARIQRVEAGQQRRLSRGASVLGSIGAAAPFIGLFGTVWGIMNAFIGIAHSQTTNLAVVAPGIAEALLTTAFGLVAAIPAVLVYNAVTRAIAGYRVRMNDAATHVMCLLSRELDSELDARRMPGPGHVI
ncbi:tonB-system energizer ExbB [Xanthomonas arboricola]|uniref:tonB-system energizer ExbB n=1 Tax=Xanthomonas arboricola TaxID=56448 RepID=UPI0011B05C26|nr:tonB-system energizer ExbB [Xanthomonas arboricola]